MYNITHIEELGTDYNISDNNGTVIKTIQVIPQVDIIDAGIGDYEEGTDFDEYLEKSISMMTGFEKVDPARVLWYATYGKEVALAPLIEYAMKHGYDKIILEHLEDIIE